MLILEIEQKNRSLITEQWNDPRWMLIEQKHIVPFVNSLEKYITEAELTPDQIKSLFTSVQKQASDSGSNRTAVGKGVDATKWINNKINELGASLAKSGPVTNLDQKVEDLKRKIAAKDTKTVEIIKSVSEWAKANPGKASIAVGVLTAAAAMVGGPLAGAVGGFLSRATKDLLQGSKLSTAVGKSVKTATYGAIAGWALESIGNWLEGFRAATVPYEKVPGLTTIDVNLQNRFEAPGMRYDRTLGSIIVPEDSVEEFMQLIDSAKSGDIDAFNKLYTHTKDFDLSAAVQDINISNKILKDIAVGNDEFLKNLKSVNDAIAAIAQGSISGKIDSGDVKVSNQDSKNNTSKPASESIILSHRQVIKLTEGVMDTIKGAGKSLAGKAKSAASNVVKKGVGAAQQAGQNITTKITADKLLSAWKKAGSPTDSKKVYQVLRNAGVSDEIMEPAFKSMNIPFIKGAPRNVSPTPADTGPSAMAMRTPKNNTPAQAQAQAQAQATQATPKNNTPAQAQATQATPKNNTPAQATPKNNTQAAGQQSSAQTKTSKQNVPLNDWIVKWFDAYMQGVEWKQELPTVKKIAQDIAKLYVKDKKSAQAQIENLAATAWEITTKNKGSPRGFSNVSSSASTNQKNNITNREITRDPNKTQDFANELTPKEREILKKALEQAK
jgi:hypothetical protein